MPSKVAPSAPDHLDQMLTTQDVADRYNVCRKTVMNWVRKGHIKALKFGTTYRFAESEMKRIGA